MAIVLFFDLARRTGWAHDGPTPGKPVAGVIKLPAPIDDDFGPIYSYLRNKAFVLLDRVRPTVIGFEAPILSLSNRPQRSSTDRLLKGYAATIECLAADWQIPCRETAASTIKKFLTGDGRAEKDAMMKMGRLLGWEFGDDEDACDACAGWAHLKSLADPHFAPATTPMFAKR